MINPNDKKGSRPKHTDFNLPPVDPKIPPPQDIKPPKPTDPPKPVDQKLPRPPEKKK